LATQIRRTPDALFYLSIDSDAAEQIEKLQRFAKLFRTYNDAATIDGNGDAFQDVLQGVALGDLSLRRSYRLFYNNISNRIELQRNVGTDASPSWSVLLHVESDGDASLTGDLSTNRLTARHGGVFGGSLDLSGFYLTNVGGLLSVKFEDIDMGGNDITDVGSLSMRSGGQGIDLNATALTDVGSLDMDGAIDLNSNAITEAGAITFGTSVSGLDMNSNSIRNVNGLTLTGGGADWNGFYLQDISALEARTAIFSADIRARNYSGRNLLINGNFDVWQRGTSFTGLAGYGPDRWSTGISGGGTLNITRSTTVPDAGSAYSFLATVGTQDTSIGAGDIYFFFHRVEGFTAKKLKFGGASAFPVCVSFWARSSVTGTYHMVLRNSAGDRNYAVPYTINAANTFEKKIIVIPGDITGTWLNTNGIGLDVLFVLALGSTFQGPANTWHATALGTSRSAEEQTAPLPAPITPPASRVLPSTTPPRWCPLQPKSSSTRQLRRSCNERRQEQPPPVAYAAGAGLRAGGLLRRSALGGVSPDLPRRRERGRTSPQHPTQPRRGAPQEASHPAVP
jgi:hypothetical protein